MLKLIQVLKYFKAQGFSINQAMDEIIDMIDNRRSEYFNLLDGDYNDITVIFENDDKFNSILTVIWV